MTDTEETMTPAETINALSPEEVWERYVGDQSRAEFAENTRRRKIELDAYAVWAVTEWHMAGTTIDEREEAVDALAEKLRAHLAADGIDLD